MNARNQRAQSMMETKGHCSQIDSNNFKVRSQTDPSKFYIISKTENGLKCECKDHNCRKADCKHIQLILKLSNTLELMPSKQIQYNYHNSSHI